MIKLTSTKEIGSNVNFLIYAEAGWGKTTQCKNVEAPLIISAEGGLLALSGTDLPVFEINNREDCNEVYDWIMMSAEANKYKTICIDSLSEIAEVLLTDEKQKSKDARQAYGVMFDEMSLLIRGFRDMKKDVYFSAKMKRVVDDASGAVTFTPSVPGQMLLQALPHFFDEVFVGRYGKLEDGSVYRYLQTTSDMQYTAKDRSGTLTPVAEPHLGKVIETIKSGKRL